MKKVLIVALAAFLVGVGSGGELEKAIRDHVMPQPQTPQMFSVVVPAGYLNTRDNYSMITASFITNSIGRSGGILMVSGEFHSSPYHGRPDENFNKWSGLSASPECPLDLTKPVTLEIKAHN
jgi:hypothetical protein